MAFTADGTVSRKLVEKRDADYGVFDLREMCRPRRTAVPVVSGRCL
jgi:hypothetical protein